MLSFIRNLIFINTVVCFSADDVKQKEIEALEKEKYELLRQLHNAIDDSVSLLQKDNTTQNAQGANYMLELKRQLQVLNESDTGKVSTIEENSHSELENRRKLGSIVDVRIREKDWRTTKFDKLFDIKNILYGKKIPPEKLKSLLEARTAMQKKLDEWLLQKELEKQKIRDRYLANKKLLMSGLLEKCPRYGVKKNKKKNYRRSHKKRKTYNSSETDSFSGERAKKRREERKKVKYPCCRKCCKKSYLGCL